MQQKFNQEHRDQLMSVKNSTQKIESVTGTLLSLLSDKDASGQLNLRKNLTATHSSNVKQNHFGSF
jgi:hypothetical protein